MSCKNFEIVVTDLARGQMLEAGVRENTLAHTETCEHCASRFADQKALTAGLRAVASTASSMDAPLRIEAALVSAYRRHLETPVSPVVIPTYRTLSRWAALGIAAAAAVLVVSAFTISRLLFINQGEPPQQEARANQPEPISPSTLIAPESAPSPTRETPLPSNIGGGERSTAVFTPSRPYDRQRGLVRNAGLSNRPTRDSANDANPASANEEITTEFLPLTYGGLSQVDDGQVVRIEVPRSALQSFGLPVNVERAGGRVKADVLLGHDGVARAIRFVR